MTELQSNDLQAMAAALDALPEENRADAERIIGRIVISTMVLENDQGEPVLGDGSFLQTMMQLLTILMPLILEILGRRNP